MLFKAHHFRKIDRTENSMYSTRIRFKAKLYIIVYGLNFLLLFVRFLEEKKRLDNLDKMTKESKKKKK